ncbi:MAG: type II toxin-antitoxin system RelE/ParE family toxin [Gammaproteobacteria bacterium]|nr:type II toxin-antitoxin system RelE/ParE family toxin [Gammaproteobacteria bacterium]
MIKSFRSKVAEDIYHGTRSRHSRALPKDLHHKAHRLLDQLNAITTAETLRVPPGNHLEKLKGDLVNFWSIRINKQWRVIFQWKNGDAWLVDIVDYH